METWTRSGLRCRALSRCERGVRPPSSTTRCVRDLFTARARRQTLFQDQLEHFYHRQLGRALVSVRQVTRRRTCARALRYHSAPSTEQ